MGNLDAIARGLREAPEVTKTLLLAAATEATLLVWNEYSSKLEENMASGMTRKAITTDAFSTPAGVLGVVANATPAASYLELGTKPSKYPVTGRQKGFVGPPRKSERIEALAVWAVEKLGVSQVEAQKVAFLAARKIAREGLPARRPMGLAVEATEGQIVAMFERAADQIATHLVGSGT